MTILYMVVGILLYSESYVSCWTVKRNSHYDYPSLHYYDQLLDHFNPTVDTTFRQRYFLSDQYWVKGKGPIFFYTGNEGDVTSFINNTGFIWDIAPVFQAMVVFAEHRYYGETLPYGDVQPSVNTTKEFAQLTAEQALADFAVLIRYLRESIPGANESAVVAFGGSYGGMLSAWLRIKYPHVVDGAIAASAPVNAPGVNCDSYNRVVTDDFLSTNNGEQCVKNIRKSWSLINKTADLPGGLNKLSGIFRTCTPLQSGNELINWFVECWGNIAMVDYPYPANFLAPLPAWPVNATCDYLSKPLDGDDLLQALFQAISVYSNHTGSATCSNTSSSMSGAISASLWNFQSCTEMVFPMCANHVTDMFPASKWDYDAYVLGCQQSYGVTPRPRWLELNFGGVRLSSASNIVFSNGKLDPWHPGGVLSNMSDSVIAIFMSEAAHHLDLRHHDPNDPPSVIQCRETQMMQITKWIAEKYSRLYKNFL